MMFRILMLSSLVLWSVVLTACKKVETTVPEPPLVMAIQPNQYQQQIKSYAGEVQARQQIPLSFRVAGQMSARLVDVGDTVNAGQVLARLDSQDSQLSIQRANAEVEQAQSALKLAETELKRYQSLLPLNAVSQSQYDSVLNQHKTAVSRLQQAQAQANTTKNQNQYNQLIAEKNGVITQRLAEVGQVVSAGQSIYQLAVNGERDVVIGVSEKDVKSIRLGQTAWVSLWVNPEQQLSGKVREISPDLDSSHTYQVKVSVSSSHHLQLGQTARVFFQEPVLGQLSVPLTAISAEQQNAFVWVIQHNADAQYSVKKVPVQVLEYGQQTAQIQSDLQVEDWIVMAGVHLLREKQAVRPIDQNNKAIHLLQGAK